MVPATGSEDAAFGSHVSSLHFSHFVGSLGNTVGDGLLGFDEDEEVPDQDILSTEDTYTTRNVSAADIELEPVG